jgi:predicted enzyme related to lactoylglutathione lyase
MKKPVVHFEIGCSNIQQTSEFYEKVFGWEIEQEGNAGFIKNGPGHGIPGHLNKLGPDEPQKYITIYIETDSLAEDLKAVKANGGSVLVKPIKLPDGREFAWFEDIAGNTIGLINPRPA